MILKELAVVLDTYTNSNGEEKKKWLTIGHIHQTKNGDREYITLEPHINLAAIPRKEGDNRVYVNLFEPRKDKPEAQPSKKPGHDAPASFDDHDVPF